MLNYWNLSQWTVKQSVHIEDTLLSGLLGLTGFRAVNVPYKNAVSDEMILIVGGYNDWKGKGHILAKLNLGGRKCHL